MKGKLEDAAVCPFYISDGKNGAYGNNFIKCEGVCKGNIIQMLFKKNDEFKNYTDKFCCSNYHACLIAKMLTASYEN